MPLSAGCLFMNVSAWRYGSNNSLPILSCFSGNRSDASAEIAFLFPPRWVKVVHVSHGGRCTCEGGNRVRVAMFIPHFYPLEPRLLDPCWEHQDPFCVAGLPHYCPEAIRSWRLPTTANRNHLISWPDSRRRTVCCLIRSLRHPCAAGGFQGRSSLVCHMAVFSGAVMKYESS